jgi:hypothetical protein
MNQLPEGYHEIKRVNLQKDKKVALKINLFALLLMLPLMIIGILIKPIKIDDPVKYLKALLIILVLLIVYVVLHEAVHGIAIFIFTKKKPKFGFTGLYAYAGSEAYFNKKQYVIIALAPIIVWGVVLLLLNIILPFKIFWIIYFIQVNNISGAVGDLYITHIIKKMPPEILIQDTGIEMTMYSKQ